MPPTKGEIDFNSHAHVERDFPPPYPAVDSRDFNSHAHVERDSLFRAFSVYTVNFNSHAHVERDQSKGRILELFLHFNSHAHVERDETSREWNSDMTISTHTLTWSVTSGIWSVVEDVGFQLTRSRGA